MECRFVVVTVVGRHLAVWCIIFGITAAFRILRFTTTLHSLFDDMVGCWGRYCERICDDAMKRSATIVGLKHKAALHFLFRSRPWCCGITLKFCGNVHPYVINNVMTSEDDQVMFWLESRAWVLLCIHPLHSEGVWHWRLGHWREGKSQGATASVPLGSGAWCHRYDLKMKLLLEPKSVSIFNIACSISHNENTNIIISYISQGALPWYSYRRVLHLYNHGRSGSGWWS